MANSKYHNTRIKTEYGTFDSRKEYKRWIELQIMQKAGVIKELERQVPFILVPAQRIDGKVVEREVKYVADFVYYDNEKKELIVEDTKSPATRTKDYIIKRKLMLYMKRIRITEV